MGQSAAASEGQMMSVAVDGAEALQHKVEGGRVQGNGNSGPGATVSTIGLPTQSLTVVNCRDGNLVLPFSVIPGTGYATRPGQ